ncbi:ATP-dependent protease la (LON) substrate-binding domain-containing protein [Sarocladium implicatum]|nr:ATP-dependent protease la (LON) substrate-binding domain-containing protein [Sarocladium implicatum]
MSPHQPQAAETSSGSGSPGLLGDGVGADRPHHEEEPSDEDKATSSFPPVAIPQHGTGPRDIIRLYQCPVCSKPYYDPITLPCGKSICRTCLPQTHVRSNITYPGLADRIQGFQCPFEECGKEHALGDCGVDVILNKAVQYIKEQLDQGRLEAARLGLSTRIKPQDTWAATGMPSLRDDEDELSSSSPKALEGGRLVATWIMATEGNLRIEAEIVYQDNRQPRLSVEELEPCEKDALKRAQEATRSEMDCQVCYALYYDPLTTSCGHTFCRNCLHRILDHSRYCPICRRKLTINPLLNRSSCPSNQSISRIIETYWADDLRARGEAIANEEASRLQDFDVPLFVCTLSFPMMPTFLHVFEPRYRLMLRRALDGDRTFGMVLPRRSRSGDDEDAHFHPLGTLLRIVNVQFYADGRSLIETVGLSRFRVLRHGWLDGYTVGKTERIDDMSLEEEEAVEAAEATPIASPCPSEPITPPTSSAETQRPPRTSSSSNSIKSKHSSSPPTVDDNAPRQPVDLETMPTQALMEYCTSFVARMRSQSVPWLTERLLAIYGECPDDPALFPWWFASVLPVKDMEKYRLIGTSSVRHRLKICSSWILEWETSRW